MSTNKISNQLTVFTFFCALIAGIVSCNDNSLTVILGALVVFAIVIAVLVKTDFFKNVMAWLKTEADEID